MPIVGKPVPFYRPILKTAIRHVLVERDLWVFGIFALILGSGSALETVMRARNGLEQIGTPFFSQLFPSADGWMQWINQLAVLSVPRAAITITLASCLVLASVMIGVAAQAILVRGADKKITRVRPITELVATAVEFAPKVLIVDLFAKACLVLCVSILLSPLPVYSGFFSDVLMTLKTAVSYGLMFAITVSTVFAISEIVNHGRGVTDAVYNSISTFLRHPATCIELCLILFAINIGVGIAALAVCLLLSFFYTFFFLIGAALGSVLATTISTAITFFTAVAIVIVFGGTTTAYNYAVLTIANKKLAQKTPRSKFSRAVKTRHLF
jgi:hypothetical protein